MAPRIAHVLVLVIAGLLLTNMTKVYAQSTSFTYQGRLTDGGAAANGSYDFQFTLWDALTGGTQQPQPSPVTVTRTSIAVTNGVFTVQLDFGAGPFPGSNRWLETSVRLAGGGAFTILTPRQQITSTPYAIRALNAGTADALSSACVSCVQDSQINALAGTKVSGIIPIGAVPSGSSNYIQNSTTQQNNSNFNISGNGTAAGALSAGSVNAVTQYNIAGQRVLSIAGNSNVFGGVGAGQANSSGHENAFVGTSAGSANTTGSINAFFGFSAGQNNTTGSNNSFFGEAAGSLNTSGSSNEFFGNLAGQNNTNGSGNVFVGQGAGESNTTGANNTFVGGFNFGGAGGNNSSGNLNTVLGAGADVGSSNLTNATAIGANAQVSQSNSLVLGSISGLNAAGANTNVGIGTTSPTASLDVLAAGGKNVEIGGGANTGSEIKFTNDGTQHFSIYNSGNSSLTIAQTSNNHVTNDTGTPLMSISSSGNVGIGTTAPGFKLDVNGEIHSTFLRIDSYVSGGSSPVCVNVSNNRLAVCNSSSLRYKTRVERFGGGLEIVKRLNPITFDWKESGMHDVGLAAEEVEQVAPLLTFRNNKGEIEGVKYNQLSAVFVNAFKEQQAQIATQQEQLKREEAEIRNQQQQLNALKSLVCRSHRRASVCK